MKYFKNYPYTAESLKAEFRALCLTMHPDKGGNADEFKAMSAEYEQVTNDLNRANEEAAAREQMARAAEEARRRREEEEREEEARKAAARPEYERKCNKWAHLMEDLTSYKEAEAAARKNYGWSSQEAKAAGNAYRAARRRNLVAMAKAAFPGVKFTASINTGWGGGATISWNEGPTVEEFKAATDYEIFVSGWDTFDGMTDCAGYERADFTEFANNYGDFSGCVSYDRTEEKEHREEVADIICSVKPSAAEQRARDGRREDCTVFLSDEEIVKICSLLGIDADKFKKAHQIYSTYGESKYFELFVEWFTKWSHYTPQPKAPEFVPKYGKTYRAIKKALGGNVFGIRKTSEIKDIFALCDDLTGLEIGKIFVWEGKKEFSGMYSSNYKNTAARIEKMQAVGITLDRAGEKVQAVAEEVREALRRERQDIERQRQEWEAEQRGEKPAEKAEKPRKERKPTESKADTQKAATANETAADGLTMEQYSEKATVIRGYNAEQAAELEAMGGKEWRNLRGGKGYIFSTRRHGDELAEWFARYSNAEKSGEAETADTLESGQDITDTQTADEVPTEPTADYVNKHLEIRNALGLEFADRFGSYWITGRARFAFYVAPFGWLAFTDSHRVYCPKGGRAALESIKNEGGFLSLDGIEFVTPLKDEKWRTDKAQQTATEPQTDSETATAAEGDTLESPREIDEQREQSGTGSSSAESRGDKANGQISALFEAVADFFGTVARIAQEAAKYEGVTIPAATLARWKAETEQGTKRTAETFAEVCACLASLTPDSREKFDALGVIFWTLSEQLRNGTSADTLAPAVEFARAQLFDLIDATQSPNQAARVREAFESFRVAA